MPAQRGPGVIRLVVPRVRVRTTMQLVYHAEQAGKQQVLAKGKADITVYPVDLLAGAAERMAAKSLLVWDVPDGLPALLNQAGIKHTLIARGGQLQFVRPDCVIVGADRLGKDSTDQAKLLNLASAGASVLVLRQTQPDSLAGYHLARRMMPPKLAWAAEHPLTRHLRLRETPSLGSEAWAVQLPADEPALEIAFWPREVPGKEPAPIDALVVTKTLGKGRIVLCQVPLGPWQSDPRSQLFLVDALDYLASPVGPTPPPSRRPRPVELVPVLPAPSISIP